METPRKPRAQPKRSASATSRQKTTSDGVTETAAPSPYRTAQWTVQRLRTELRQRNLSATGRKEELLTRLEGAVEPSAMPLESDVESGEVVQLRSRPERGRSRSRRPDERLELLNYTEDAADVKKALDEELSQMTLLRSPIWTLQYFVYALVDTAIDFVAYCRHHRVTIGTVVAVVLLLIAGRQINTPYHDQIVAAESTLLWYVYWVALGVASSIGLGTGLHTFVLFLGPLIARVTMYAYECGNLDFDIRNGPDSFQSKLGHSAHGVTMSAIYFKVFLESFAWGAGTAIGELPPYFVARGAALAGQDDEEFGSIEALQNKPRNRLTLWEKVQLFMFKLMERMGFFGILLSASIPNPLFDLAGITCGHFLVPFGTFFGATFIGKAVIKSAIQTWFIIALFSKDTIEWVLAQLRKYDDNWYQRASEFFHTQQRQFGGKSGTSSQTAEGSASTVSVLWNGFIALMIGYFLLSIVQSLATGRLRKEREQLSGQVKAREVTRTRLRKRATE